jgi:glycosyl hydrolase family 38
MTQGLLNSTFHDRGSGERRRDLEEFRGQLADAVFEEVGKIAGRSLQTANLPLFKRGPTGLEQVVGFRLLGVGPTGPLWLECGDNAEGGRWEFRVKGPTEEARASVAEVSSPEPQVFRVVADNGDLAWRGEVVVRPQRKWSVSLVHHTHLDVGYTDRQEVVTKNHLQYLDSVLDLVDQTNAWDDDVRFRWNVEVNWPLERWFAGRSQRDQGRMLDAIRAGQVSVGAMSLNMHTEACAIEELYEMVRFAVELRTTYGVPVTSAMQTDVPGGVTGLIEVLTDVGVNFLSVAHNYAGRSVPYLIGGEKLERPFYWKAPSGKRLLVWHTDTLHGNAYMEGNIAGLAESYAVAQESFPCYLAALAERPYPFESGTWLPEATKVKRDPYPHDVLHLRVQGRYGDNAPPSLMVSEIAREWNSEWAYPHLRVDLNERFFEAAVERLGPAIPEWQGDWADWWADGLGSGARMMGWARGAQAAIRVGRTLHALSDVLSGAPPSPVEGLDEAYEAIGLFDEHTWGACHPWEDDEEGWGSGELQSQRKDSFAQSAREAASSMVTAGARRTAERLGSQDGLAGVVVFNPSGWSRTDLVRVFLPYSIVPSNIEVGVQDGRDGSKIAIVTEAQENPDHRPAGRYVAFLANQVPGLGYARFNIVEGSPVPVEVSTDGAAIANEYHRVEYSLADAWISSLRELGTGRELVNPGALLGLNAYIFDRYATSTKVDHLSGRVFTRALDLIADRVTGDAAVVQRRETSELGESLTIDVRAPGCSRLLTTISVWRGVPRVEIRNRVWKQRTVDKQSVFFAFPFATTSPELSYELPGAGTSSGAPQVPGCPQHMRALRHWAALSEGGSSIAWATVDAPLVQFGDIHSPYSPFPGTLRLEGPEPGTIYSWVLNNIWDTNFPTEQGGEMSFRYAVASGPEADAGALGTRLGESVSTPLVGTVVPSDAHHEATAPSACLCEIERPEVRLVQATSSKGGGHLLLWLNNLASEQVTTRLDFPALVVKAATIGTVFEEDQVGLAMTGGPLQVTLKPGETRALSLLIT